MNYSVDRERQQVIAIAFVACTAITRVEPAQRVMRAFGATVMQRFVRQLKD